MTALVTAITDTLPIANATVHDDGTYASFIVGTDEDMIGVISVIDTTISIHIYKETDRIKAATMLEQVAGVLRMTPPSGGAQGAAR